MAPPSSDGARVESSERHRLRSVRSRITAGVMLLSGLALAGAGLSVFVIESARTDQETHDNIQQELSEFRAFQRVGVDPETGERFTSSEEQLSAALRHNVPGEFEAIVTYWDGKAQQSRGGTVFGSGTSERYDLTQDPNFAGAVRQLIPAGGTRSIDTPVGSVLIAVAPSEKAASGAFVVVGFRDLARERFLDVMRTYTYVAGVALLLVSVGAWVLAGRLLRPVRELRIAARTISEKDLSQRIEATGNDDLTDLTRTFNDMLDRLDDAFSTQRHFLDDTGHELRTPLSIISGHLELVDPADEEEVAATRLLVLDEVDRMARIIDDLTLLAQTRRPDFVLPSLVDIGALTDAVAAKIRALADRRWAVDDRGDGEIYLDGQRITQALLQLASNAVRHTEDGETISIGSRLEHDTVVFWVRDRGQGIAAEDQSSIFERGVHRPGRDGAGLGLAIVRAIAQAHGGRADVNSTAGGGATFSLIIPREADL